MEILLTGSVAFDYLMTFPGYFKDHFLPDRLDKISLSFLADSMVRMRGGIAPNIAYTLAILGNKPHLWATVGEDFEEYRQWLESNGVDTSGARVITGEFTASFFVNTDKANAQIASFYPGAMGYASNHSLHELAGNPPDLVVISPNDPVAMIQYVEECQALEIPYIYDPSQQIVRLDEAALKAGIIGALAWFGNDYEAGLVEKMTGYKPADFPFLPGKDEGAFVVVTRGHEGSTIYSRSGIYSIPVVPPRIVVDPTGGGDAFRGGFLAGYAHGLDLEICGQMGALAATYCLEKRGPQSQTYNLDEFVERFRYHFDDSGKLDILLKQHAVDGSL